jgi:hypothetical protein
MSLSPEQLAYSQQLNGSHIWRECYDRFYEVHGEKPKHWNDADMEWLNLQYEHLCNLANIKPW